MLSEAYLIGADLIGADLSRTYLYEAKLEGALLTRADLSGADLSGANLSGANLTGAILTGADLFEANLSGAVGLNPDQLCAARTLEEVELDPSLVVEVCNDCSRIFGPASLYEDGDPRRCNSPGSPSP